MIDDDEEGFELVEFDVAGENSYSWLLASKGQSNIKLLKSDSRLHATRIAAIFAYSQNLKRKYSDTKADFKDIEAELRRCSKRIDRFNDFIALWVRPVQSRLADAAPCPEENGGSQ